MRGRWALWLALGVLVLGAVGAPDVALAAGGGSSSASQSSAGSAGSAALGGSGTNPLSGFPQPPVSTQSTSAATVANNSTAASGGSSVSGNTALFVAIGALVLLGGISFYIWHDARHRAPVKAGADVGFPEGRRAGSKPPQKSRKLSQAERRRRKRGRAKR